MSQQDFTKDASAKYRRRLFIETGFGYQEIANSVGFIGDYEDKTSAPAGSAIARIVEEYKPPTPVFQVAEVKLIAAPSILHAGGKTQYKAQLRVLFNSKLAYNEFIFYSGNQVKYYDENGSIYMGIISEQPEVTRDKSGNVYDVKISLILVKKETYDRYVDQQFTDIEGHWAEDNIKEMAHAGLITQMDRNGNYVYVFRPDSMVTRAEAVSFLNRTRKYIEKIIRG